MNKQAITLFFCLISHICAFSQNCDPTTPAFNVDLTGQPHGTWISPNISRNGKCCGVTGSDVCIQFTLRLDTGANGIRFDIVSGAIPPGALYFQINCGPPHPVGEPICVYGVGPHIITFCKPGNNANQYAITSIPEPSLEGTQYVSQACTGDLKVWGLIDTSVYWSSVPPNPVYDSYLSCSSGCDSVTITPPANSLPPYIDYKVCGYVIGGCIPYYYCDTMRVYFVNDLAVDINPNNPVICYGGTNATLTANPTGGILPYDLLWSTGDTIPSITVGPGTYTVSLRDGRNCSVAIDTVIVTAVPSAIVADAGPDALLCLNNSPIQLNGSVVTAMGGQWYGGGSFQPSSTTLNASYTPSSAEIMNGYANLQLITTGNQGCPADTDFVHLDIAPNPVPTFIGPTSVCKNSIHQYSALYSAGTTYNWSVVNGTLITTNLGVAVVQWNGNGPGSIALQQVNSAGCDSTISLPVTVQSMPGPVLTGPTTTCTGSPDTYSITPINTGSSYNWFVTGGTITSSGPTANITWQTPGLHTVTLTETNAQGCDSTVQLTVNVIQMPAPNITGANTVCRYQSAVYTTPSFGSNTYSWNVTGGTIINQGVNWIAVYWNNITGTGSVSVTERNSICDSTTTIYINVLEQPEPGINGPTTPCTNTIVEYHATGIHLGESLSWQVVGGTITGAPDNDTVQVSWNDGTVGTLRLHVVNVNSCDSIVTLNVYLRNRPTPSLSGPPNSCEQKIATYSVPLSQNSIYNWQVSGGNIVNFSVSNTVDVYWLAPGSGTISVQQISPDGCDSSANMAVRIDPNPAPAGYGANLVCQNETNVYYTLPTNGNSYQWTLSGGSVSGPTNQPSISCNWQLPGTYTLSVVETTPYGCVASAQFPVQVAPKPTVAIAGNQTACLNNTATYTVNETSDNYYQYTATNGIIQSNNGGTLQINWQTAGQHAIYAYAVNANTGCDTTVMRIVQVDSIPKPVIRTAGAAGCSPLSVTFNNLTSTNINNYLWSFGDGSISVEPNPQHVFTDDGNFQVRLYASTPSGCTDSSDAMVFVYPTPSSDFDFQFGIQKVYAEIGEVNLLNTSEGAMSYLWNLGNGNVSQLFEPPVFTYDAPGTYDITLSVVNAWGCTDQIVKRVEVIVPELIFVPEAFTPNGDTRNDYFSIACNNIVSANIRIFNRWGEKIYESDDMNFRWDGFYKNQSVQNEVYVYQIDAVGYHGTQIRKIGKVTVVY